MRPGRISKVDVMHGRDAAEPLDESLAGQPDADPVAVAWLRLDVDLGFAGWSRCR